MRSDLARVLTAKRTASYAFFTGAEASRASVAPPDSVYKAWRASAPSRCRRLTAGLVPGEAHRSTFIGALASWQMHGVLFSSTQPFKGSLSSRRDAASPTNAPPAAAASATSAWNRQRALTPAVAAAPTQQGGSNPRKAGIAWDARGWGRLPGAPTQVVERCPHPPRIATLPYRFDRDTRQGYDDHA